jgi:hypothetical protein
MVHFEDRVHWALYCAGYVADDISYRHEVFVIDTLVRRRAFDRYEFP